jgi:hypothetical protein
MKVFTFKVYNVSTDEIVEIIEVHSGNIRFAKQDMFKYLINNKYFDCDFTQF